MEVEQTDPDGDAIFILDDLKLRVSSVLISAASPVFKALFSPRFKEGSQLLRGEILEIALPDDDPDNFRLVCNIIHYNKNLLPKHRSLPELIEFLPLVNKYDLYNVVVPVIECWIPKLLDAADDHDRFQILEITYKMQHAGMFKRTTSEIIMKNAGPIVEEDNEGLGVPCVILEAMEKRRKDASTEAVAIAEIVIECDAKWRKGYTEGCTKGCTYVDQRILFVLGRLMEKKLWPTHVANHRPLEDVLGDLPAAAVTEEELFEGGVTKCDSSSCASDVLAPDGFGGALLDVLDVEQIRDTAQGLCYICVSQGSRLDDRKCGHKKGCS